MSRTYKNGHWHISALLAGF